ncbi:MAG TPA: antibiotic biosynthesis monooxygenase [Albitalea sp.]|nr:antibiotic biosynthesis monooxygenase [Albitalea sp.]HJW12495.1 antibiotic biosynthesis monooxygenase [Albitalea sp.]
MVVTIFRSRLRPNADMAALEAAGMRMYELASAMPGFVSYKDYTAQDGESVAIVEFADHDSLLAWRNHTEHKQVQARGRAEFMSEYRIQVCESVREYSFDAKA